MAGSASGGVTSRRSRVAQSAIEAAAREVFRAADFARFLALAKSGHPYESHMVIEDVPGKTPEPIAAALQYQQKEHMERGIEYGKKVLDLGVKWRG